MTIRAMLKMALGALLLSSCSMNYSRINGLAAYHRYDRPAKLPQNPEAVRVKVSLSKQRAYVMEGSQMLLAMPVSVGAVETPTPIGDFLILNKEATRRETTHGYAYHGKQVKKTSLGNKPLGWSFKGTPLPFWCEFKPGLGFHTGWIKHSPCTDGGLRMHENLAPKFFRLVSAGTPLNISYRQPEDEKYALIPLPPDAGPLPDYDSSMYLSDSYFTRHKTPEFN